MRLGFLLVCLSIFSVSFSQYNNGQSFPCLYLSGNHLNNGNHTYESINCVEINGTSVPVAVSPGQNIDIKAGNYIHVTNAHFDNSTGGMTHLYIEKPAFNVAWFKPSNTPGTVGKYKTMEIGIELPADIKQKVYNFINQYGQPQNRINPFDPDQIDVQVQLTSPSNKIFNRYAFYYQPYKRTSIGFVPDLTDYFFRFRFAPDELGTWKMTIKIVMPNNTINGNYVITFKCVPSNHKGYLVKKTFRDDRDKYLYYKETGTAFKGVGMNICHSTYDDNWTADEFDRHVNWITSFANNGGNFMRLELGAQNALPDWKQYNNYNPKMKEMYMYDQLIELLENKGIYFIMFRHHVELKGGSCGWDHVCWQENPYRQAFNLQDRMEFFTNTQVIQWQKKCLRYIMARWGYNSNMAVYEYSELDNYVPDIFKTPLINIHFGVTQKREQILDWLIKMRVQVKAGSSNRVFFTVTFSSGSSPKELKEYYNLPYVTVNTHIFAARFKNICDVVGYHNYGKEKRQNYRYRFLLTTKTWENFNKPIISEEIGYDEEAGLYCCTGVDFHNEIWATAMHGNLSSGLHWHWDRGIFLKQYDHYFKYLSNFLTGVNYRNFEYKVKRWKDKSIKKARIMNFYMVRKNKEWAMGWVHNATYRWRNFYNSSPCIRSVVDNQALNYTCVAEDGHLIEVTPAGDYGNNNKYKDYYGNNVSNVVNKTFKIKGLKGAGGWKKHWYRIDFYQTQNVSPGAMFSYSLTQHTNISGTLKPAITLKSPSPDYAYKVTYLGKYHNNPNARTAQDSLPLLIDTLAVDTATKFVNRRNKPVVSGKPEVSSPIMQVEPVTVFPNPGNGFVTVKASEAIQAVTVYSLQGKILYTIRPFASTVQLSLQTLPSGTYLMAILVQNRYHFKKLIIQ